MDRYDDEWILQRASDIEVGFYHLYSDIFSLYYVSPIYEIFNDILVLWGRI